MGRSVAAGAYPVRGYTYLWFAVSGLVVSVLAYLAAVIWDARREVQQAVKKPMFICDKHGPMAEDVLFTAMDTADFETPDGRSEQGAVKLCPLCFDEALKQARKNYK